jgi:Zn2+/Cd2+-exporting ATPase
MELLGANPRITKTSLTLEGMDCSDCELVLEHRLGRLDGVLDVAANFNEQSLEIKYDQRRINRRLIEKRVRQMGYEPVPGSFERWLRLNRALLFSLISGLLLLIGWLGHLTGLLSAPVVTGFYLAAYIPAGYDLVRLALHSLGERRIDTDTLMFAAALGAASLGDFAEGALLIFLFALGHALQDRALNRARSAVSALGELAPRMAVVRRGQTDEVVPVEKLGLEDVVVVRPGERVPVDGEVRQGFSLVNETPLTGESLPVEKSTGDKVFAGSFNTNGTLEITVSRLSKDSTLARVMKLVEQAQSSQSPTQLQVDRFTRVFVPFVLLVFAALLVYPLLTAEPFEQGFVRAVTFLVAASPCALALGTPATILAGISQAARHGVLIKGGVFLENLGRLRAIAFDKTGTLTLGQPHVTDVIALPGWTSEKVVSLAVSIEGRSNHPLAQAILEYAQQHAVSFNPAEEVENFTGRGVRAEYDGRTVWVGSLAFWKEQGLRIPGEFQTDIHHLEAQGKSVVLVGEEDRSIGVIGIADILRPESRRALAGLSDLGLHHTVMLSGDNPAAVASIADQLGLLDYRAQLLPEEKLRVVDDLVAEYRVVAMVGDGMNDAPALARATVGITLGSAKNDLALEAADVALMASDLCRLPFAVGLGRAVKRITLQNLVISLGSILFLTTFGLAGFLSIGMLVFLHEGATLLVVGNALRLFTFDQPCSFES